MIVDDQSLNTVKLAHLIDTTMFKWLIIVPSSNNHSFETSTMFKF